MKKGAFFLLLIWSSLTTNAQVFVVKSADDKFFISTKKVYAGEKRCLLINYLAKKLSAYKGQHFQLLILLKVFGIEDTITLPEKPINILTLEEYIEINVLPKLYTQILLPANNYRTISWESNINQFDSLVVFDGKNYRLIPGVLIAEFFNLSDFNQTDVLQTNQATINTKAKAVKVYKWVQDSLPIPKVNDLPDEKIFLIKKGGNDFTFFRWPGNCEDCSLSFYNEFVYRKGIGIVAFKSKYVGKSPIRGQKIYATPEYYYFR